MKTSMKLDRRRFLQTGIVGAAALASNFCGRSLAALVIKSEGDPFHGLKIGITSYTFRKFSLEQALAMTKQAGVKYISLKDAHLPMKSSQAERQEARRKVEEAGLTLMGGGVIYMKNNEEEIRAAFDYAKE